MEQKRTVSISLAPKVTATSVVLMVGSLLVLVSPFMTWFQEKIEWFGTSFSSIKINGFDLGELSDLSSAFGGESVWSRGEYALILGILALVLALVSFFLISRKKGAGLLLAIAGVLSLLVAIEPTVRILGEDGVSLGVGMYLLFVGSLLLIIGGMITAFGRVVTQPLTEQQPPSIPDSKERPNG